MNEKPFISICILSYNRPDTLHRLLKTIDATRFEEIEIVICEDCSPKQSEIREVVEKFSRTSQYKINYQENEKNLGYDGTFCQLVKHAKGEWLIFMGDDDEFVRNSFDSVTDFLKGNPQLGYVLKTHYLIHDNGEKEKFQYFPKTTFFEPGIETYVELFRKSVFIAGFMIKGEEARKHITDRFDGTMLIQLYLLAEVALRLPCAFLNIPFTQQYASYNHNVGDVMYDREEKKFIERKPTLEISLNFLGSFSQITNFIDEKYSLDSTKRIKNDMSKYFYPSLAVHRDGGLLLFFKYVKELNKMNFNSSLYYYLYVFLLTFLGKRVCDQGIFTIKKVLGRTPRL